MLGTFRILISNEGCGFTRDKCTKRVTIFFENGEIELFNGNVCTLAFFLSPLQWYDIVLEWLERLESLSGRTDLLTWFEL